MRQYTISKSVLERAVALGITDPENQLQQMARLAARITHPDANHRFRQYIMYIEDDGMVTMLDVMKPDESDYYNDRTYEERKAESKPAEATA